MCSGAAQKYGMSLEDEQEGQLAVLTRVSQFSPLNAVQLRREIADETIEVGRYTC